MYLSAFPTKTNLQTTMQSLSKSYLHQEKDGTLSYEHYANIDISTGFPSGVSHSKTSWLEVNIYLLMISSVGNLDWAEPKHLTCAT